MSRDARELPEVSVRDRVDTHDHVHHTLRPIVFLTCGRGQLEYVSSSAATQQKTRDRIRTRPRLGLQR